MSTNNPPWASSPSSQSIHRSIEFPDFFHPLITGIFHKYHPHRFIERPASPIPVEALPCLLNILFVVAYLETFSALFAKIGLLIRPFGDSEIPEIGSATWFHRRTPPSVSPVAQAFARYSPEMRRSWFNGQKFVPRNAFSTIKNTFNAANVFLEADKYCRRICPIFQMQNHQIYSGVRVEKCAKTCIFRISTEISLHFVKL